VRVLVSGSHGLIGGSLVKRLESEGHTVHRVVRSRPQDGEAHLDLVGRKLDVSRLPGGSLDRIDAVFNLSGERITPARWSAAKRERLRSSRIVVTEVIADAIASAEVPPTVFVSASAIGIYGERGDEELDEDSTLGRGFLAELCRAWEDAADPARRAGVRVVHARSGVVIAKDNPVVALQLPLLRLGLGATLGTGRQWFSWISIDDEIGALISAALTTDLEGACNLTSPNPVRYSEFVSTFAHAVNRRARLRIPRRMLEVASGSEATREVVLVSERVLPRRLLATGYRFESVSLDEAFARALDARAAQ
jgi:uncharacterized protein (TIGR01777 family)